MLHHFFRTRSWISRVTGSVTIFMLLLSPASLALAQDAGTEVPPETITEPAPALPDEPKEEAEVAPEEKQQDDTPAVSEPDPSADEEEGDSASEDEEPTPETPSILGAFEDLFRSFDDTEGEQEIVIPTTATVSVTKIVCDSEEKLPNWGDHGIDKITANTADEFLAQEGKDGCAKVPWDFAWGPHGVGDVADEDTSVGPEGWTGFSGTVEVPAGERIWIREQFKDGYIPFAGETVDETVSAEIYCDIDIVHYDNMEWIDTKPGETYHCVAFNVPIAQQCVDELDGSWADAFVDSAQGKRKDGSAVLPARSDASDALGESDWSSGGSSGFFSLGFGGSITLSFDSFVSDVAGTDLSIHEATNGSYPLEKVTVEVSQDGSEWESAGTADNTNPSKVTEIDFSSTGLAWIKFVKLTDISDKAPFSSDADGFDLDAVEAVQQVCDEPGEEAPICDPETNLIENGGFESPVVNYDPLWDIIPDSDALLKWLVAWTNPQDSGTLGLEIQRGVAGDAHSGMQHAELDGDHPVVIWQDIPTIPGEQYTLNFQYSPRPGRDAADNKITVKADGTVLGADLSSDGTSLSNTSWQNQTRSFIALDDATRIEFADTGTDTSFGGYLDSVSLRCEPDPDLVRIKGYAYKYLKGDSGISQLGDDVDAPLFPITVSWKASNLQGDDSDYGTPGSGASTLGNNANGAPLKFMYQTMSMDGPADFGVYEMTGDGEDDVVLPIGAQCEPGKYRLVGYQSGNTLEQAQDAPLETAAPSFEDALSDKHVIIINEQCPDLPPPPQTASVTMCKVDDAPEAPKKLSGWTLFLKGALIETLNVPTTTSAGIDTGNALVAGTSYLAEASGTWNNQGGNNPADAEYSSADGWTTQMDGYTGYSTDILELQINSAFDPNSNWGAYNSAHKYAQSFVPSSNGSANFRIFDGTGAAQNEAWFGDNSGTLAVTLSKGYAGITNEENGCVTFTGVPYGTYQAGEILQDGWMTVSGTGEVVVDYPTETITIVNHRATPPPIDVCPNLDGIQEEVPEGYVLNDGECVEDDGGNPQEPKNTYHTTVVTPSNMQGWGFFQETPTGSGTMVTGPSPAPLGTGSAQLTVDSTGGEILAAVTNAGTRFDNIVSLSYKTYRSSGAIALAPTVQFEFDNNLADADTAYRGRIVYEPYHTQTVSTGAWQTWNALDDAAGTASGNWWGSSNGTSTLDEVCPQSNPCTWAEVKAAFPDGGIRSAGPSTGGTFFKAGGGWTGGFIGAVDQFVIGVKTGIDTHTETYDFEPTITACNDGLDNDEDGLVDAADPGCHTGDDPQAAYDPLINDEANEEEDDNTPEEPAPTNSRSGGGSSGSKPKNAPSVLGAFTGPAVLGESACGEYLTSYIKFGGTNNKDDVMRLQSFLNEYLGLKLSVDGIFGKKSMEAVKAFQVKEKGEVLSPWVGITLKNDSKGTGWVYKTTKRWINMIKCPELNIPEPQLP